MRLAPENLHNYLKQNETPSYRFLLYGNDSYLINENTKEIVSHLEQQFNPERIAFDCSQSSNHSLILNLLTQPSLFSLQRLILLRFDKKLTQKEVSFLQAVLKVCSKQDFLIIQTGTLTVAQQKGAWFQTALQEGIVLAHWPMNAMQFKHWVKNAAARFRVPLSNKMLSLLCFYSQNNPLAAHQALACLQLTYYEHLDDAQFQIDSLTQQSQFDVFALCDAMLAQEHDRIIAIISSFQHGHTVAIQLVLWSLIQTTRTMLALFDCSSQNIQQVIKSFGVKVPATRFQTVLRKSDYSHWATKLEVLAQIEKHIKTNQIDSAWQMLLTFCLHFTQPQARMFEFFTY